MRLKGKIAAVIGAGQTPGSTIGNGRATAIAMAREGAKVMLVDSRLESAEETRRMIAEEGGTAYALAADVSREADCKALAAACVEHFGGIDLLQFNVGIGTGDSWVTHLEETGWDRIVDVNLKGCFLVSKHVLPIMQKQHGGSIVFVSSIAAVIHSPLIAYKASKAGMNAMAKSVALTQAEHGIRCNVVMPGLIDTPMAVEGFAQATGRDRDEVARERDACVPLGARMGTAWDIAWASVFLHSGEARFITGIILPVDGGQSARCG